MIFEDVLLSTESTLFSALGNQAPQTNRGFTDHEHLDDAELIHMNGRAYDYNLGRFLSVDPFIQAPGNSQSMNPYSYIMNNPLSGTDPSGYLSKTEERDKRNAETRARRGFKTTYYNGSIGTNATLIVKHTAPEGTPIDEIPIEDIQQIEIVSDKATLGDYLKAIYISGGTNSRTPLQMASLGIGTPFTLKSLMEDMTDLDSFKMRAQLTKYYTQGFRGKAEEGWVSFSAFMTNQGFISQEDMFGYARAQGAHREDCNCNSLTDYIKFDFKIRYLQAHQFYTSLYMNKVSGIVSKHIRDVTIDTYMVAPLRTKIIGIVGGARGASEIEKQLIELQLDVIDTMKTQSDRNLRSY